MGLPLYLAMTASEMETAISLPAKTAYMACHFSPYSTGLSNLPRQLPPNAILTLNDRTPISGHDPQRIARQLQKVLEDSSCIGLLLDFQRPDNPDTETLSAYLAETLPCPVAVSHHYAKELSCGVFLPPVPPNLPLTQYILPWGGREIWLEAALDTLCLTVKKSGCVVSSIPCPPENGIFHEETLHCHYSMEAKDDCAIFRLHRNREDLRALLEEAQGLGISGAIGLYQELGDWIET